ncbi:MAG: protein kinase family protein [Gammaproteobacteria bacterium]|nr:MAG: protein kinase family protein [Gammaproteobacteria bacterium]
MAYPSLEQYTEALQSPQLVILDPELRVGRLKTTGLGLPLALCGGFALTYTVEAGGKKFALRCFHKESRELEKRYAAISAKIKQLSSPYFLPFEFIPQGIRIKGANFPIVKMAWAKGQTLAEFLESEHKSKHSLSKLRDSLSKLAEFIERNQIAHGDIQPENVMVSNGGAEVQLIDYDGMFVDSLRGSKATEYGQANFQHPQRSGDDYNQNLDRFSFIALDIAIQSLIEIPTLWATSKSEPSAVVFRRNDFIDPGTSDVFSEVLKNSILKTHAENLARVAAGRFDSIPSLSDFLQGKGVPNALIEFKPKSSSSKAAYQGAYVVCNAIKYDDVLIQVGNRIELVGKIHSIKLGLSKKGKQYLFINFSIWSGKAVKLAIWSDQLDILGPNVPDQVWVGRWLSVTGLVDPPYHGQAGKVRYTHLSITITGKGQIQQLSEAEAAYRLNREGAKFPQHVATSHNSAVLQDMGRSTRSSSIASSTPVQPKQVPNKSNNQRLLEKMRAQVPATVQRTKPTVSALQPRTPKHPAAANSKKSPQVNWLSWIIAGIICLGLMKSCL